jgi:ABC-type lipoprotein export system ATPase subunit
MPDEPANPLPVFFARRLCKTYGAGDIEVRALRDVDLDICEGEFVILLGPSGSGKSTLLNILGGLDAPTSGEARWREHNLVGAGEAELTRYRREHVGFVFQFYNLIPSLTALENVALVAEIAERPLDPRQALVRWRATTGRGRARHPTARALIQWNQRVGASQTAYTGPKHADRNVARGRRASRLAAGNLYWASAAQNLDGPDQVRGTHLDRGRVNSRSGDQLREPV